MEPTSISPKTFLKARRPERFSDTVVEAATELDRSLLEFHLSSLTSRSQETDFQRFAHQLCEREICPNLLPQTGPTGGGDSKVDSETYPVADDLALAWYTGEGREGARERWAFAFSAKADWLSKVQSDIAKIAGTKRGYTKAFFVTNQAVPDRKRAEVEDDLRTKYTIDVRILDRTWILDRVFKDGHEALAITELGVTAVSRRVARKGPLDVKHEGELEAVETRIDEALQTGRFGHSLVEDALHAADLARNLERPRVEVEGRYTRADRLALKYGTPRHQVEVAYQWAWALFWWFEDWCAFVEKYGIVEKRACGSRNAYDLEQLFNLWNSLTWAVKSGALDSQTLAYPTHTNTLLTELERLCGEKDRPSTALQAETLVLLVQLICHLGAKEPTDEVLRSLQNVVLQSEGLVGYPFEPLAETLSEIGQWLEGVAGYDELFDTIVKVASTRDGEVSAARLLLTRGEHQFHLDRPVDAIATLGRSLGRLYKHETRKDIVRALYLCGCAYGAVGLHWAARGTLLAAASVATHDLWQYGEITPYQAACYRQLKWVELRLGRLPHILAWHELDVVLRHELASRGYDSEKLFADEPMFNALLGRLLLRTDFFDLQAVQRLPDVLDRLGLDLAADAVLYALGYGERLEKVAKGAGEDPEVFAQKWRSLTGDVPLPDRPLLYYERKAVLQSRVLGCQITVESQMTPPCIEVAESVLAALESFLATSALDRAAAREPELTVEVRTSHFADAPVSVAIEEKSGRPHLTIGCRPLDPHNIAITDQVTVREAILHVAVTAIANTIVFKDFERDIEALFRDERVSERAVAFTTSFGVQSNVLGASPKTRLSDWIDEGAKAYPVRRTEPWKPQETSDEGEREEAESPRFAQGAEAPAELLDPNQLSHEQIRTVSLIRERLWDRAEWTGTVFLTDPTNKYPPVFGLVFRNREAGREIFGHWRREFGEIDKQERIRLSIVRGIDTAHPHAYRVVIGPNPTALTVGARFVTFVNRIHQMDATTPENLDRFLNAYSSMGMFHLAPAFAPHGFDASHPPDVELDLHMAIHQVHVRNAWEIAPNDIDSTAIHEDDHPVIPENIGNPPVLELIRRRAR